MSDLVLELRSARPVASETLRERVRAAAADAAVPAPRRRAWGFPRPRGRRVALVLVPACVGLAVVGALAAGLVSSTRSGQTGEALHRAPLNRSVAPKTTPEAANAQRVAPKAAPGARSSPALPVRPAQGRLQDYTASMRLRVDDVDSLSSATQRAVRLARALGGYVVSVSYGSEGRKSGQAYLTLRVPVARVQTAVVRLSGLGTILGQNVRVDDVQPRVDALEREIVRLHSRIAGVDARLRSAGLGDAERARLQFQRERLATALDQARRSHRATIRQASFATVSLELTTPRGERQAAPPGRFRRTIDDAGGILLAEAAWTLLVLAVAAPFALLLALGVWAVRAARRLADRRLLET